MKLQNFAENNWFAGSDDGKPLNSAVDGRPVATISSAGVDFAAMLDYARRVGGENLRKHTFHDRAFMLKDLALFLMENKKWWMIPILAVLVLVGALLIVGGSGVAPFIYTLF